MMSALTARSLKFAVLSDIHAYSASALAKDERRPSYVEISAPDDIPGENPFAALAQLVERENLRADVLICGGDLGDRAHPASVRHAWRKIEELARQLECRDLIVATGNHDVDSRYMHNDHDARSILLGLSNYPFDDELLNNEYWARNVVVVEKEDVRYVVLNSSAYHGNNDDHQHGRISRRTLEYLRARLAATKSNGLNVLVVHHHPQKVTALDLDDNSEMIYGAALMELLDSGEFGRWLLVHGHRHFPNISYGQGSAESTVVFSAGSFSAVIYDEIAPLTRNQFYMLDVELSQPGRVKGTFQAWDWISDEGFGPAQTRSGLPHLGGFGSEAGPSAIAAGIADLMGSLGLLSWPEVVAKMPSVRYLSPKDLDACKFRLRNDFGIKMIVSDEGVPIQFGKVPS